MGRHCKERQRRGNPQFTCERLDCFASLAMTRKLFGHFHDPLLRRPPANSDRGYSRRSAPEHPIIRTAQGASRCLVRRDRPGATQALSKPRTQRCVPRNSGQIRVRANNFRRATTDNIAGDLGGRQSTRLISCKVIDVRVATSCTSRAPLPSPSPAMGEVPEQAVDGPRGETLTLLGGIDLQIRGFRLHRVARCRRP